MNTPVSFELAKLLREKGFKKPLSSENRYWTIDGGSVQSWKWFTDEELAGCIDAPTIAEIVMWFYEKHNVWVNVMGETTGESWFPKVEIVSEKVWCNILLRESVHDINRELTSNLYYSISEAYEAAIKHTLENLTK